MQIRTFVVPKTYTSTNLLTWLLHSPYWKEDFEDSIKLVRFRYIQFSKIVEVCQVSSVRNIIKDSNVFKTQVTCGISSQMGVKRYTDQDKEPKRANYTLDTHSTYPRFDLEPEKIVQFMFA